MRLILRTQAAAIFLVAGLISGCRESSTATKANFAACQRGMAAIKIYGCGKCHSIPGIRGADGVVGPPLESVAQRTYIAGNFPNTPDTLTRWIMKPQIMKPKTAMPSLGLTESQSRDIVAYLETLK